MLLYGIHISINKMAVNGIGIGSAATLMPRMEFKGKGVKGVNHNIHHI